MIEVKWKVVNKNDPDRVYKSINEWFTEPEDENLVKDHLLLEQDFFFDGRLLDKMTEINPDGKSFIATKVFKDQISYDDFQEARKKLPRIDKHLSYTLLSSSDMIDNPNE
tara:strand:+ start:125 stop:454 length:330 start_codon:yes stop_codon:yes gene_type:complete